MGVNIGLRYFKFDFNMITKNLRTEIYGYEIVNQEKGKFLLIRCEVTQEFYLAFFYIKGKTKKV